MPRQEGLRPIGESVKKIIEKIKKEREERQKKSSSSPRTQPKLPGMKKGGEMRERRREKEKQGIPPKPTTKPTRPKPMMPPIKKKKDFGYDKTKNQPKQDAGVEYDKGGPSRPGKNITGYALKKGGEAKKKDKGQINPGEKYDDKMRQFNKKLDKRAAKYEMVSKFQKRTGRSFPYALNSIEVQKIMDKGKTGYDDISVKDLAKKEGSFKKGGLTGVQKKLDANKDGKISGEDFKILRGKNNKMKGGGIAIKGTNFKGVF